MKPIVVFLGNSLINALHAAWRAYVMGSDAYDSIWVHYQHVGEPELEQLKAADVIVVQISDIEEFDVEAVNPRAKLIRFPYVNGSFLWPYSGHTHPDWGKTQMHACGVFAGECGDGYLAQLYRRGMDAAAAVEHYASLDIVKVARIERRFEIGIETQRLRDQKAGFDVSIADFIADNIGRQNLFISRQNLAKPLFWQVARVVFQQLLRVLGDSEAKVAQAELLHHISLWGVLEMPIHPGIVRHFGVPDRPPGYRYRVNLSRLTFDQYTADYMNNIYQLDIYEGVRALDSGDYEAAEVKLARGFELAPQSPDGAAALGRLFARLGRKQEALAFACAAVHLDTDERRNLVDLAQRYLAVGWHIPARAALERSLEIHFYDWHSLQSLVDVYAQTGERARGLNLARDFAHAVPDSYLAQARLGHLLQQNALNAEAEEALSALRNAAANSPQDGTAQAHLAYLLWSMGELHEAEEVLRTASSLSPEKTDLKISLADLVTQLGQVDEAIRLARELAEAQPGNAQAKALLARLLWRCSDYEAAAAAFRHAIGLDPTNLVFRVQFSNMMVQWNKTSVALAIMSCRATELSSDPDLHAHLGRLRLMTGDLSGSERAYQRALELDASHEAAAAGLTELQTLKAQAQPTGATSDA